MSKILFADRIGGENFGKEEKIYKFEKIKRAKDFVKRHFPDKIILDFGVGEPDDMADERVVNALCEAAKKWENRGYADNGIYEFKVAASEYMKNVYGVSLSPDSQINHAIGSKSALSLIPVAFINPGDITITTVPGYPVLATYTSYLGGEVYKIKLLEENDFYPDLSSISDKIYQRAKLFYVNYPNNPTGKGFDEAFFKELIRLAKKYEFLIVHDAAYSALVYKGSPKSIFSIDGAFDVAIEVHSLSKAFNMTGWRLAFVCGREDYIKAFMTVKDNTDSGQFKAIQWAGIEALKNIDITEKTLKKYERRLKRLVEVLSKFGFPAKMPEGTFYLYVKAPKKTATKSFANAEDFSEYLIKEKAISTVPWDDANSYIRFSATFETNTISEDEVFRELERRLEGEKFVF